MLRRVRTRQGLRLEEVSFRAGLPLEHLNALETATFDRSIDRMAVLRSLRTYANFLGLSGERLVLSLIDLWPGSRTPPGVAPGHGPELTRVPAVAGATSATATGVLSVVAPQDTATVPVVGRPFRPELPGDTIPVAATRGTASSRPVDGAAVDGERTAQVPQVFADTGPVPAAARPRAPRSPLPLRLAVGLVVLAIAVGLAGLAIDHYRPSWLRALGITHGTSPPVATTGGGGHPAVHHARTATDTPTATEVFSVASTSPTGVALSVQAPTFTTQVAAVGGEAWVQVDNASGGPPLYAGILTAGQTRTFTGQHELVVNVGSKAAHLFFSVGGRTVGYYLPQVAPFTIRVTGGG
ncbi:MAG: helix-turn-helix domain-containing protein [Acidimicrobiales bacterium]